MGIEAGSELGRAKCGKGQKHPQGCEQRLDSSGVFKMAAVLRRRDNRIRVRVRGWQYSERRYGECWLGMEIRDGGEGRNIKMRVAFPLSWSWLGMVVADTRLTMEMTRRPDDKPPTDC